MKKRILSLVICLVLFLTLVPQIAGITTSAQNEYTASPTVAKVLVDGKEINFCAYNINGSNYFKLRDMAMALLETDKAFDLAWSQSSDIISLYTKKNYQYKKYKPIGNELTTGLLYTEIAIASLLCIYYDDNYIQLRAYNIKNNNYFKLREIAELLDFSLEWSENINTISINTNVGYSPVESNLSSTNENAEAFVGNAYLSTLPSFISEMPIISYVITTENIDVSEEQHKYYLQYPMLRNIYIIAEDLENYGFDIVKNNVEKTLYIKTNNSKKYGMMDGEIVNAPYSNTIEYALYRDKKNIVLDGRKIPSYSIGEKSLISVTAFIEYFNDCKISPIDREIGMENSRTFNFDLVKINLYKEMEFIPKEKITNFKVYTYEQEPPEVIRPLLGNYDKYSTSINFTGEIADGKVNGMCMFDVFSAHAHTIEYIGRSEDTKKEGVGIFSEEYKLHGAGVSIKSYTSFERGVFQNNILIDGVSYMSKHRNSSYEEIGGYRYEGAMYSGYLRECVSDYKFHFGYRVVCEGTVENGEFCGYYRHYDENGKLVFEGQYGDYFKSIQ